MRFPARKSTIEATIKRQVLIQTLWGEYNVKVKQKGFILCRVVQQLSYNYIN